MKRIIAVVAIALTVAACGQTDPPTTDQLKNDGEYFYMTSPTGVELECYHYGAESWGTEDSKSWFAFDCWPKGNR